MQLFGRRKIFTGASEITRENVIAVIRSTSETHKTNQGEIQYLYDYYRGKQDILGRQKTTRPEICNNTVINHANEIVSFKVAYLLGEPIQYVSRNEADSEQINRLNEFMYAEDKESKDKEIADWVHICGVGYQMVRPDKKGEEDGAPFNILTLDPRYTYSIYSRDTGNPLVGAVQVKENSIGDTVYIVYTPDLYFEVKDEKLLGEPAENTVGMIPIIEYIHNEARLGAFEPVVSILDKINVLVSNRIDDIEQFVTAFDVFQNCDISAEQYEGLRSGEKALKITSTEGAEAKVYRIVTELSQAGVQSAIDDLTESYLIICGMPNRNGGSSTSDTGTATIFRDGWQDAEARASDTEKLFKRSSRHFLRLALKISGKSKVNLAIGQIDQKFPRRNNINQQSKAQVLISMLGNDKIHPLLAYIYCGMFPDPESACTMGLKWYEQTATSGKTEMVNDRQVTKTENTVQGSTIKNAESEKL